MGESAEAFWRPIINDFRPIGVVRPDEVARFFVDRYEDNPLRSVFRRLQFNITNHRGQPTPYKGLLTGHVGSGKSTELIRVGQVLAPDFFVIQLDAELTLATEKANHFDILLSMGLVVRFVSP